MSKKHKRKPKKKVYHVRPPFMDRMLKHYEWLLGLRVYAFGPEPENPNKLFKDADFTLVDFSGLQLGLIRWEKVIATDCDFSRASLVGCQLVDCKFVGCKFNKANLEDSTFTDCEFIGCTFDGCHDCGMKITTAAEEDAKWEALRIPMTVRAD